MGFVEIAVAVVVGCPCLLYCDNELLLLCLLLLLMLLLSCCCVAVLLCSVDVATVPVDVVVGAVNVVAQC